VAKHKCGSCHFFQEAGLAGSGWCHHPQRKVSNGVLIMVRRNELACRDEWSRSLWQPREGQHSNGDTPFQRQITGPLPPAPAESARSVLNGELGLAASSEGEDVLLSEARIISEAHDPWQPPPLSFPTGHFDPRTAIFRAREAYRDRVRAKAAAERQSAGAEAMIESPEVGDFSSPSTERASREPEDRLAGDVGAFEAAELPLQTDDPNSWLRDRDEERSAVAQPPQQLAEAAGEEAAVGDPLATDSSSRLAAFAADWQMPVLPDDQTVVPAPRTAAAEEASSVRNHVDLAQQIALPDWYRADLPRVCRTCRDYRPAAEGQRGWCANSWAFTHSRLVLEDDPAPCQSAIGDWWLPVDDVWLVAADVSSHGRATPLFDRLTGKSDRQRRRS
jgi:hypothetical protein